MIQRVTMVITGEGREEQFHVLLTQLDNSFSYSNNFLKVNKSFQECHCTALLTRNLESVQVKEITRLSFEVFSLGKSLD